MKFPVLVFQNEDSFMIALDYPYLMGDIRFAKYAFKNTLIIDSNGYLYHINGVKIDGNINLWYSIKLLGLIARMEPIITNDVKKISLETLKDKIRKHITQYHSKWLSLGTITYILSMTDNATDYETLIKIFK